MLFRPTLRPSVGWCSYSDYSHEHPLGYCSQPNSSELFPTPYAGSCGLGSFYSLSFSTAFTASSLDSASQRFGNAEFCVFIALADCAGLSSRSEFSGAHPRPHTSNRFPTSAAPSLIREFKTLRSFRSPGFRRASFRHRQPLHTFAEGGVGPPPPSNAGMPHAPTATGRSRGAIHSV